ncbi:MAG: TIGR02099 family protein [Gallionella sp.]|nr:TIGR02099 family protein [Gallionella sp.]
MWNSRPVRLLWHSFNWLTRIAIVCAAAALVLVALGIIVLRYWLLPDIEQYHEKITAALTHAIGHPVTIEKIEAGWQGLSPRLSLVNLSMLDEQQQPALVLPSVRVSVSWLSLPAAELRFASLDVERPELLIRRDVQGNMFVGGVAVAQRGGDNTLADWLLHQSRMVVRNALIVWVDEQRGAPPLVLRNVDVRIDSLLNHHRFALRASVPAELASPLDVRGDFHGVSFDDVQGWRGQLFTQLQYADITAWRPWLDMPKEFSRGRGALRGWLDVSAGKISRLQVDLAVRDVDTKLADDVPEMNLRSLRGRASWHALAAGFEVETKNLTMRLDNGVALPTTDLYLRILNAQAKQPASGEIRANVLQLETLVSLANFVPIPADLRAELDAFAPRGKVDNLKVQWQGTPQHLSGFLIKGQFQNIALRQVGKLPGFSGLTAEIDGDQSSGKLRIKSHQLHLDAPGIMREPVAFHALAASASWQHQNQELVVDIDNLAVSNADLEGMAHGSYRTLQGTPGILDLTVDLSRADIHQAARYTPLIAVNRKVNDWLNDGLLAGSSNDFHLRILGNLNDFPFDKKTSGQFELSAHVQGGAVQFAKDWPVIENADGKFWMRGKKLELLCTEASTSGVPLRNISVQVPDITLAKPALETKLQAAAGTRDFLQYIQSSPVRGYTQGFTDAIRAQGDGELDLAIRIPQLGENLTEVQGEYLIKNNEIDLGGRVPILRKVNGELRFTQSGLQTHLLTAEILGGPSQIEVKTTPSGGAVASLSGVFGLKGLRRTNPHPLFNYLHGGAAWNAQITAINKTLQLKINSDLKGLSSDLPAPFGKARDDNLPLSVELKSGVVKNVKERVGVMQNSIAIELGALLSARVIQQNQHGVASVKRATVNFGGQGTWPEKDGIWVVGSLTELSVQGWGDLLSGEKQTDDKATPMPIDGGDLHIARLTGYGHTVTDLHVSASKRADGLAVQLDSQVLNGEVVWQPHGYQNGGKLVARLDNLSWFAAVEPVKPKTVDVTVTADAAPSVSQPGKLPALDVSIGHLQVTGKKIGRLELVGYPDGDDWRLRRLLLTNPDGSLSGDGVWIGGAGKPQTKINLVLDIGDVGKILDRSGYPNTVKDGKGKLAANLAWAGAPEAFNLSMLTGTLKLDAGKGQFLKIDPTVSKLSGVLSVLSLQALPQHIALDFTDVFSGGFQFDKISGNAAINNGSMTTQDLQIDGSSAKILMRGGVDLVHETQDLRVEILPNIGGGVSLIGVFAINPVVGISAFVVDKILGNPLDKLVSFEYNISGTWADPNMMKVGEKSIPVRVKADVPINATEPVKALVPSKANQPSAQ